MEKGFTYLRMMRGMRAIYMMVLNKERGNTSILMEIFLRDNGQMIGKMD